jgi:hypothetical protein
MGWREQVRVSPRAGWLVALTLCWFSAGLAPFREASEAVWTPNDFTPDYVVAATWLKEGRCGRPWPAVLGRATANAQALRLGARQIHLLGPYYTHPPPALAPIVPLAALGYRGAVAGWLTLSIGLLGLFARVIAPMVAAARVRIRAWQLFLLLLFWPPVLSCLEQGQWTIALATAMALGHVAWERRRPALGAAWMAVATALKLSPLVAFPGMALRSRRAALWFGGVLLAIVVACLPFGGVSAWVALFREAGPNAFAWQTYWQNTTSISGLASRLFLDGMMSSPLVISPLAARLVRLLVSGTLVGLALWASWRVRGRDPDRDQEGCVLALWYLLPAMLNPLGWPHYALLLLLPAALAGRAAVARGDGRAGYLVLAGIALATVPKETLYLLTQPFPVPAPRCAVLSMHLYAGLLVFAGAARGALRRIDKPSGLK